MLALLKLFSVCSRQATALATSAQALWQEGRRGRNTTDWQRPPALTLFKERPAVFHNANMFL